MFKLFYLLTIIPTIFCHNHMNMTNTMNMTDHSSHGTGHNDHDSDHSGHSNMSHSMNHEGMAMYFFTNNTGYYVLFKDAYIDTDRKFIRQVIHQNPFKNEKPVKNLLINKRSKSLLSNRVRKYLRNI